MNVRIHAHLPVDILGDLDLYNTNASFDGSNGGIGGMSDPNMGGYGSTVSHNSGYFKFTATTSSDLSLDAIRRGNPGLPTLVQKGTGCRDESRKGHICAYVYTEYMRFNSSPDRFPYAYDTHI